MGKSGAPASRKAFDTVKTESFTLREAGLIQEKMEEYIRTLEDARPYPVRAAPIPAIIGEEAADWLFQRQQEYGTGSGDALLNPGQPSPCKIPCNRFVFLW